MLKNTDNSTDSGNTRSFYKEGTNSMLEQIVYGQEEREEGFSLVELLVVIVIIGILSAIAIAAFLNQRQKANDAAVESDIRNAVISIETVLVDHPNADNVEGSGTGTVDVTVTEGETEQVAKVILSESVTIDVEKIPGASSTAMTNGYRITGYHDNGSRWVYGNELVYESNSNGFLNK